ncbi:ABC transporter permease [Thermococcus aggregans]|uniref:ABC transporter permease n=1 Tax=Thermococcus aggregans TaxID=110163 RepID=A0A9E7SQB3_THEAG|nr:ABC transporter permease [Thermococcus aggregans]USS41515.1 ABC transporter permease [Thermococcus aggregans]
MKELNIAFKEFYVAVRSKRFVGLLIFYILLIFLISHASKDQMINQAGRISVESLEVYGVRGEVAMTPVSMSITTNLMVLTVFGALIGAILGADSLNREIEEGTIKVLLSHPVYRDQVINGKFIGNGFALVVVVFIGYTFSIGYLLIIGVPIDGASIVRALLASIYTLIYMLTFLSLGILLSTLLKKAETAMFLAVILTVFFTIAYPVIVNEAAYKMAGDMPYCSLRVKPVQTPQGLQQIGVDDFSCPAAEEWKYKLEIWKRRLYFITPAHHYTQLIMGAFAGERLARNYLPLSESLPLTINSLAMMIVQLLLPFSIAYMKFMTSDLK